MLPFIRWSRIEQSLWEDRGQFDDRKYSTKVVFLEGLQNQHIGPLMAAQGTFSGSKTKLLVSVDQETP